MNNTAEYFVKYPFKDCFECDMNRYRARTRVYRGNKDEISRVCLVCDSALSRF